MDNTNKILISAIVLILVASQATTLTGFFIKDVTGEVSYSGVVDRFKTCNDRESNQDVYKPGFVDGRLLSTNNLNKYPDTCITILEASDIQDERWSNSVIDCSGEKCYVKQYWCDSYKSWFTTRYEIKYNYIQCKEGCSNGACLGGPTEEPAPTSVGCTDSEVGIDYNTPGKLTLTKGETTKELHDMCRGNILYEGYCTDSEYAIKTYDCTEEGKICDGGACISTITTPEPISTPEPITTTSTAICTDSDALNLANRGKTCKEGTTSCQFDKCSGSQVVEYYCNKAGANNFLANCPTGYSCSDGACVEI